MEESYLSETGMFPLQHLKNDSHIRKSGLNKLHVKSRPLQVCMTCLDTETKLYLLSEYNLGQAYTNITGFEFNSEMQLDSLCAECVQHLINFNKFREKSRRAHILLLDLIDKHKFITVQNIKTINRVNNKLKSSMVKKIYEPNHYDLYLIEPNEDENKVDKEMKHKEPNKVIAVEPHVETVSKDKLHQEKSYESDNSTEFVIDTDTDDNLSDNKNDRFLNDNNCSDAHRSADYKEFLNDDRTNKDINKNIHKVNEKGKDTIENKVHETYKVFLNDSKTNKDNNKIIETNKNTSNTIENNVHETYKVFLNESRTNNDNNKSIDKFNETNKNTSNTIENNVHQTYKVFLNDSRPNNDNNKSIDKVNKTNRNTSNTIENNVENKILTARNEIEKCISNKKISYYKVKNNVNKVKIENKVQKKVIRNKLKNNLNTVKEISKHVLGKGVSKNDVKTKKLVSDDLKMFTVTTLSYEEQVADVRKRQETSNYKNSEYKCSICCKGFSNKHTYNGHMEKHTNKFGELECAICGLHFKYRMRLRHHINNNHTMRYACTVCSYVAKQKFSAYLHEQWHKGTKYLCPHCEEQFIRLTTYLSHLRIKHPSDFVCTLCGYSFVSQKGMSLHMKLKHRFDNIQDPSGPVCASCDIRFASDAAYNQHLKVSPKHSCDGDRTRNDSYIWSHNFRGHRRRSIKSHTESGRRKTNVLEDTKEDAQVVCEQCGVHQKDFRSYAHHFRKVHPDKNRTKYAPKRRHCLCEHCGKFLPNPTLLKYHMSIHVGVRGFQCDVCDKKFVLKTGLAIHMKTHSVTRVRYECPVCGKSFTTLANRARHVALHSGLKPFKCDFCDKTFATAAEKTLHTSHVHMKKPWPKRERGPRTKGAKGDTRRVRPLSAYKQYDTHKTTGDRSLQDE